MITIKTKEEIAKLKTGGKILAFILRELAKMSKPGISLLDLEKKAAEIMKTKKVEPSFKNYQGYPAILCTSVNHEVVHCPPRDYFLKDGDILSIDCGIKHKGLYTDSAITIGVGKISTQANKLIETTRDALYIGIKQIKPGNTIGDISNAIQKFVEKKGFSVVKSLVGHGVGYKVHEDPRIPNYGKSKTGPVLQEGMVICLEPMVNIGSSEVVFAKDGWQVTTRDTSLSAHFEHTIAVTKKGSEIITQ
jgi:methionyl aminopeptidase